MRTILVFLAGCFFGGIVGVFATCLCVSAARGRNEYAAYAANPNGPDPRD